MKTRLRLILIVVAAALLTAGLAELFMNIKVFCLEDSQKGIINVSGQLERNDEGLMLNYDGYVDRLEIGYECEKPFCEKLTVKFLNKYGQMQEEVIEDNNPLYLNRSVVNIRRNIKSIKFEPVDTPFGEQIDKVKISSVCVKNTGLFNPIRFICIFLGVLAIGLVIVLRDICAKKLEFGFLIVGLCAGISLVLALPLVRTGYDEENHTKFSFYLTLTKNNAATKTLSEMITCSEANDPRVRTQTYEEYRDFIAYLNENAKYKDDGASEFGNEGRIFMKNFSFGYVHYSAIFHIGRWLNIPYGDLIVIARMFGMLVYIALMFLAIRILKKGKLILTAIGLMPTMLFLASTINYDAIQMGIISIGMALFMNLLINSEKTITFKNFIPAFLILAYGCFIKLVYAPLLLTGLFWKKEQFKTKKSKWIMRGILVLATVFMLAFAALPRVGGADSSGDARGGDTNTVSQVTFIFDHSIQYAKLLIKEIGSSLFDKTLGGETLDNMYFLGIGGFSVALILIFGFAFVYESKSISLLSVKRRIALLCIALLSTIVIWTSMYITFTPAGSLEGINGVQGRYFIPLLLPLMFTISTVKISVNIKEKIAYTVVLCALSFILTFEIFGRIIMNSCI